MCVSAMSRDMFILTRKPELLDKCINTIVNYIQRNYGDPCSVDAIVGYRNKYLGNSFAFVVAWKLRLSYSEICKAGKTKADPGDLIQETYVSRDNKVSFFV